MPRDYKNSTYNKTKTNKTPKIGERICGNNSIKMTKGTTDYKMKKIWLCGCVLKQSPSFRKKLNRKFDHSADGFEAEEGKKKS